MNCYPKKPILIVDDQQSWLASLEMLLARRSKITNVVCCSESWRVMGLLTEMDFSLILLDYAMPGCSGEELLAQIVQLYPQLPVVMMTGFDQVDTAVRCMELGATNYLVKTLEEKQLTAAIQNILQHQDLNNSNTATTKTYQHPELFKDLHCISDEMQTVFNALDAVATDQNPLTLVGEPGTGKRMLAKRLLKLRPGGEFIELDCSKSKSTFCNDSEWLATHLEKANGGVIYLRHFDRSSPTNQQELLKQIHAAQFSSVKLVLSLPNRPSALAEEELLRVDLANLLEAQLIEIPPLRGRKDDLPGLTQHFMQQAADKYGKKPPTAPEELKLLLQSYNFPGNVRELKEMVDVAIKAHDSRKMSMNSFKKAMEENKDQQEVTLQFSEVLPTIEQAITLLITEADLRADGNQTIMAKMLGISRPALNKRLQKLRKKSETGKGLRHTAAP